MLRRDKERDAQRQAVVHLGPIGRGVLRPVQGMDHQQFAAFGALLDGGTFEQAACAGGVSRVTLFRWRRDNPAFAGLLEEFREDRLTLLHDRMSELTEAAFECIERAITAGDGKLAFRLLKELRSGKRPPPPNVIFEAGLVAVKRWYVTVRNPGHEGQKVEEFLTKRWKLNARDAGNCTYREATICYPLRRDDAEELMKTLAKLGAYVSMKEIEVVQVAERLPSTYTPGPTEMGPALVELPASPMLSYVEPETAGWVEYCEKRRKELEEMDLADARADHQRKIDEAEQKRIESVKSVANQL